MSGNRAFGRVGRSGLVLLSLVAGVCGLAYADAPAAPTTRPYPSDTCLISGEKLGKPGTDEAPVVINYEGREIKFCCKDCVEEFKKDPAKYLAKLDAGHAK